MRLPDEAIVKQCLEGDGNAFSLLIGKYQNVVYALCYHMVGNFADAQDLAQETLIKAYLDLFQLRDASKFAAWVHRITVNVCRMWLRTRRVNEDISLETLSQGELAGGETPDEHIEAVELQLSIAEAIASPSEKNRLIITLYYMDGMSCDEIGSFLNLSRSAIKNRLMRARKQLREELISMVEDKFSKHKLPEDFSGKVVQEVVVKSVLIHKRDDEHGDAPVVLLQSKADENQIMPIWIGLPEGIAIAQQLEHKQTPRPITHDLVANILAEFSMKVTRVVVTDLQKNTFYARIAIESDGMIKEFDARPSDSIALALRTNAPIFVAKSVLSENAIESIPDTGEFVEMKLDMIHIKTSVEVKLP